MGYRRTVEPTEEPLTLAEVKQHLASADPDLTVDDTWITAQIAAVRQYAEQETGRSLITQTWARVMDQFPGGCWDGEQGLDGNAIRLEKGPVQSVSSIIYVDMGGSNQTLATTEYLSDTSGAVTRIAPRFGKLWPIALPQIGSVTVTFVAGYGARADVPEGLKTWMKLRLAALYENREEVTAGGPLTPLPFVDSLLNPYRIFRV